MKDHYQTLGVNKNASKDEIKKAFRVLAHKYHPDKKNGDEKKFKEVNEAYSVLSNDKKRGEYDTYGRVFEGGSNGGGGSTSNAGFGGFDFSGFTGGGHQNSNIEFDIGDIFGDIFGGGRRQKVNRGRDISVDLELSFEESVFGVERKILLYKTTKCNNCNGSGAEKGSNLKTCIYCNGKGQVQEMKRSFLGSFGSVKTCDNCNGSGQVPEKKCFVCKGYGVLKKQEEITVAIPAGVNNGETVRMNGAGEVIQNGQPGDLYIKLHIKKHHIFKKDGFNLVMDLKIKLSSALLGDEYPIKTLDGNLLVKIPAGTQIGSILRVKGKGVSMGGGRRGDLFIHLKIDIPKKLSKSTRKILEELKKEGL